MSPRAPPRDPRTPKQSRAQATLDRIVQAAESILAEEGPEAASVTAVMARAGVGPGSFYARFEGKAALLAHVHRRMQARCEAAADHLMSGQGFADADALARAPEVVRRLVRGHVQHEAYLRAILVAALVRPGEPAMERVLAFDERLIRGLVELLPADQQRADGLRLAVVQILETLRMMILFPDATPFAPHFTEEDLILGMSRHLLTALGLGGQAPASYRELLRRSAALHRQRAGNPVRASRPRR